MTEGIPATPVPPHLFLQEAEAIIRFMANQIRLRTLDAEMSDAMDDTADIIHRHARAAERRRRIAMLETFPTQDAVTPTAKAPAAPARKPARTGAGKRGGRRKARRR